MIVHKSYPSSSNPKKSYEAQYNTLTGETACNCPGWTFKKGDLPRTCKHTVAILKENGDARDFKGRDLKFPSGVPIINGIPVPATSQAPRIVPTPTVAVDQVQPMLASAMLDGANVQSYVGSGWVLEEKIDGHRLLVTITKTSVTGRSRPSASHASNDRALPEHIINCALNLMPGVYDCELYLPGGTSSDVTRLDKQDQLVLAVFDLIEITGTPLLNRTYKDRQAFLLDSVDLADLTDTTPVRLVKSQPVSKAAVDAIWARGGEGAIIKNIESKYLSGMRSTDWIKVKRIEAATLTVKGFKAGKLGPHSIVELVDKDGAETSVKVLNNEAAALIAKIGTNYYLGRKLVISHQGRTKNNVYRHPMWDHIL